MNPKSDRTPSQTYPLFKRGKLAAVTGLLLVMLLAMAGRHAAADGPDFLKRDTLVASNYETESGAHLGTSVAVSGDTIVAGAPDENNAKGAVYVYVRPTDTWTTSTIIETAKLTVTELGSGSQFGASVAISGDTIVVGAPGVDGDKGAAYVFVRPDTGGWQTTSTYAARLTEVEGSRQPDDVFGTSVAISGDTIAVGAPATADASNTGMAYVFNRPAPGWITATPDAVLSDSNVEVGDGFGEAVATHGDTVVVGALLDDFGVNGTTEAERGSAYVFVKPGGGWADASEADSFLSAASGAAEDHFGVSVDIREDGQVIVVGAENATPPASANTQGAVYVFVRPDGDWAAEPTEDAILSNAVGSNSDKFGHSVSISGDTIVAGAYLFAVDDADDQQQGAAFVFVQPNVGPQDPANVLPPWVTTDAPQAELSAEAIGAELDQFGQAVATAGGTIVAGVPFDTIPATGSPTAQGSATIFVNAYCSADANGSWHVDATWVGGVAPPDTADACISTGHVITMDAIPAAPLSVAADGDIAVVRRLLVNPGAVLDLDIYDIRASQEVSNNGTLKQVRTQGTFGDVEILQIDQVGGGGTRYRGVNVDSGSDLGAISVALRETIDWFSPTSLYQYCTTSGVASAPYAQRCYTITADSSAAATVTLWSRVDELNGIAVSDLAVYHWNGSSWDKLSCDTPGFCTSFPGAFVDYEWAKGDTPGFSEFILGDVTENSGPTAVKLLELEANQARDMTPMLLAGAGFLALAGLALLLRQRHRRAAP